MLTGTSPRALAILASNCDCVCHSLGEEPPPRPQKIPTAVCQRWRDDNRNKICVFEGVGHWGREDNCLKTLLFSGQCHDDKLLNVQIMLSDLLLSLRWLLVWMVTETLRQRSAASAIVILAAVKAERDLANLSPHIQPWRRVQRSLLLR